MKNNTNIDAFEIPDWASEIKECCEDIIRIDDDSFIVFIDGKLEIDWKTSDSFDTSLRNKGGWDLINKVLCEIRISYAKIPSFLDSNKKKFISMLLGEALVASFYQDNDLATSFLQQAKVQIESICWQEHRKEVLKVSLWFLLFILVGVFLTKLNEYLNLCNFFIQFKLLIWCFLAGITGAILSLVLKTSVVADNKMVLSKTSLCLEVAFKIIVGGVCGCIVLMLAKAGMLPLDKNNSYAVYIFALISGFVERFVPDLLQKNI